MRWGVISTGRIARAFISAIAPSSQARVVAVASRDRARAEAAAREFELPRAYGSYGELLTDPEVDAVYIGLPNSLHAEWAIEAARAGKHVLCEKPLGVSVAEAETMFEAAREHGVWLMEAFMYRFHPRTLRIKELIDGGALGRVRLISASFGFTLTDLGNVRLIAELSGGALMDVGCYCVNFARLVTGSRPASVFASARWAGSGVDETLAGSLAYEGEAIAQIACTFAGSRHQHAHVIGSEGIIEVEDPFTPPPDRPSRMVLHRGVRDARPESLQFPPVDQYRLEAEGFARLIEAGHRPHGLPEMPLVETLDNMATIEALYGSARRATIEQVVR